MTKTTMRVDGRFCSVTPTGQGGYCAGFLNEIVGRRLRVWMKQPIPLDVDMVVNDDGHHVDVTHDGSVILSGESDTTVLDSPEPISIETAELGSRRSVPIGLEGCFSCGPNGWGLLPGTIGDSRFATTWTPPAWTAPDDVVLKRYVHTALDCTPGWLVATEPEVRLAVTGWVTAEDFASVLPEEVHGIVAWAEPVWNGRKRTAGSAIFNRAGELCARTESMWISV